MKRMLAALLLISGALCAQEAVDEPVTDHPAAMAAFVDQLNFQSGDIALSQGGARLKLNDAFQFLSAADAEKVLVDLWGNPPDTGAIGMLVPTAQPLTSDDSWAVVLTYSDDGYVSDTDAQKIDYDDMLKEMQQSTQDSNDARREAGYGTIELVGWAEAPHYDAARHQLYWAKDLKFDQGEVSTVNYDIRLLGRSGYLSLNAVGSVDQLPEIRTGMKDVLTFAEFNPGATYADHNPSTDKVATYGVGALIAGTVASKAGLFAKLGALLFAFKKFLIIGVIALGAGIKSLFARKNTAEPGR